MSHIAAASAEPIFNVALGDELLLPKHVDNRQYAGVTHLMVATDLTALAHCSDSEAATGGLALPGVRTSVAGRQALSTADAASQAGYMTGASSIPGRTVISCKSSAWPPVGEATSDDGTHLSMNAAFDILDQVGGRTL